MKTVYLFCLIFLIQTSTSAHQAHGMFRTVVVPSFLKNPKFPVPIQTVQDTHRPKKESFYNVPEAQVVWTNPLALSRDFELNQDLESSLLRQVGVSEPLAEDAKRKDIFGTVTPFKIGRMKSGAYRPAYYGRAMVFKMGDRNWIDVKGCGIGPRGSGTGLMPLFDCFRETYYEQVVRAIFEKHGVPRATIESYAIIDLKARQFNSEGDPVGLYLRQAHRRLLAYAPQDSLWLQELRMIASKYNLSSDSQLAQEGQIVDFGNWAFSDGFKLYLSNRFFERLAEKVSQGVVPPQDANRILWKKIEAAQKFIRRGSR